MKQESAVRWCLSVVMAAYISLGLLFTLGVLVFMAVAK